MSSKWVSGYHLSFLQSFWDMVCVALMSSNWVSMNYQLNKDLVISGSSHQGLGAQASGQLLLVCPDCDSGTPLCAINDESGCLSVTLVFQPCSVQLSFGSVDGGVHKVGHLVILMSPMHQFISGYVPWATYALGWLWWAYACDVECGSFRVVFVLLHPVTLTWLCWTTLASSEPVTSLSHPLH